MADPDSKTKPIVDRLRGSQRVLLVLLFVCLIALSGVAVAAFEWQAEDDFEDGDIDGWSATGTSGGSDDTVEISSVSFFGEWSMRVSGDTDSTTALWTAGPQDLSSDGLAVRSVIRVNSANTGVNLGGPEIFSNANSNVGVALHMDSSNGQWRLFVEGNGGTDQHTFTGPGASHNTWYNSEIYIENDTNVKVKVWEAGQPVPDNYQINVSLREEFDDGYYRIYVNDPAEIWLDRVRINQGIGLSTVSGNVYEGDKSNPVEDATVYAYNDTGDLVASDDTDFNGQYSINLENGTYNLTAHKDGYFNETHQVTINGSDVDQDFILENQSAVLTINTRPFLEHGESAGYTVTAALPNGNSMNRMNVTENATVTSGNTSVITIDIFDFEIDATSDRSVNQRTYVQANWTDPDTGTEYVTRYNVTVANLTVDNLDILPPVQRFSASLSGGTNANPNDRTILLLIIGAAAGGAASIIASSFAGVAALTMVMMLGWILGATSDGMAIVTVFIALFVGLNVAGNVDYSIRG